MYDFFSETYFTILLRVQTKTHTVLRDTVFKIKEYSNLISQENARGKSAPN